MPISPCFRTQADVGEKDPAETPVLWAMGHNHRRGAPAKDAGEGFTIKDLCNKFLTQKKRLIATRELTPYMFTEYQRATDPIFGNFGRDRRVDDLHPDDFSAFRETLAKGMRSPVIRPTESQSVTEG